MTTQLKSMVHPLAMDYSFAGFTFPKWVFSLPAGSKAKRLERAKNPVCGPYYHSPRPKQAGRGCGFYLGERSQFDLRWQWCDQVSGVNIRHRGWYADDDCQDDTIRGVVFRLPRGRGFLAGWSMGEGMASSVDGYIYDTQTDAAMAADSLAESAADRERDYQREERAKMEAEECQTA